MKNMENKNGPEIYIGENTNTDQKGNSYLKEMETAAGENRLEAYYQNEKNELTARLKYSIVSEDKELTDSILGDISVLEEAYRIVKKGGNNKNIVNICPKCGIEYENSAKFCGKCGTGLLLMQCACGEVFRKNEDGCFDKFCVKCRRINPLEQAKQGLAEDRKKAEGMHIKDEKNKKQENERQHREYINSLKADATIEFGSYPFEADGTERPIEWRILERYSDDTALLISKYCLAARRFDSTSNDWEQSEIRQWLNNEFYNATFKDEDKNAIIKNREAGCKVFLLSVEEANKYFKNNEDRIAYPTPCAIVRGAYINDNYGGSCWWWLRSPGTFQNYAAYVDDDGYVDSGGLDVDDDSRAVRVALKINLNNL